VDIADDLEDKYHDISEMCAVSVIEHEISYLQAASAKMKGDEKEFL
jgi:hypothetical protein